MKSLIVVIASIFLTACATTDDIVKPAILTVKQVEYVVRIPPKELLQIPEPVKEINVETAKQSDVARWIIANEERARTLENLIISIASFFKNEIDALDKKAKEENKKAIDKVTEEQAKIANDSTNKSTK